MNYEFRIMNCPDGIDYMDSAIRMMAKQPMGIA
jgi:hypothetical protein